MSTFGETANVEWQKNLDTCLRAGTRQFIRGRGVLERIGPKIKIDMQHPVVSVIPRNTKGYASFLAAEACWILGGSYLLDDISPFAPGITKYSDNGYVLQGAYGPRIVEQLSYILDCFRKDIYTRQAVIEIWRPNPRDSKDIPCTLSLQFLHREGKFHCIATMRSSDLWLGFPFDVFSFTMIATWVLLQLKLKHILPPIVDVGNLIVTVGSQHVYADDIPKANIAAASEECGEYKAMSIYDLKHPDDLLEHLRNLAKGQYDRLSWSFLREMRDWNHAP